MRPKKIFIQEDSFNCLCHYDTSCVELVTKHEKEKSIEYTDLSQVWHDASEEPKKGEWILGEYQGGIYQTYLCGYVDCEWSSYVKVFSLIRWVYVNDLLPKGGEQ